MSLRTAVTILLSALVCLALMGRPAIHTPPDPPDTRQAAPHVVVVPSAPART